MRKYVLILVLMLVQNVVLAQKNFLDQAYLETQAKVDTLVTPDRIYFSINIDEADSKNKKSVEQQEREIERVLKRLGIDTQKDLTISDLASNYKSYFLKKQNVLKAKRYELLLKDAVTAGKTLVALEEIGIANISISKLEYSKKEELLLELKSKAVAKTRRNAEKLVLPLNQKVGKAIHISDHETSYVPYGRQKNAYLMAATMEMNDATEPIDVEVQKIKFEMSVDVKYILE